MNVAHIIILDDSKELEPLLSQHPVLQHSGGGRITFVSLDNHLNIKDAIANTTVAIVINTEGVLASVSAALQAAGVAVPLLYIAREAPDKAQFQQVQYLKKPIRLHQLIETLERIIQSSQLKQSLITIGDYSFNFSARELARGDEVIDLTDKEASIIKVLWEARPHAVEKKELLHRVWGYDAHIDTHTLETHIYRLRQKVPATGGFILTNDGGYIIP